MSAIQRKFDEAREWQKAKAPTLIEALEIRVKRIEKAAPELLSACKALALIGAMIGSDWAIYKSDTSLPERERLNREQFYSRELEKHLNSLGDAVDEAEAAIARAEGREP